MSKLTSMVNDNLNTICPYFTMFPLDFPLKHIKKFKSKKPIIFDPFCGRGTTLYAARKLGLTSWGIDSSPIAIAIAQAKLANIEKDKIIKLARKLLKNDPVDIPKTEFFTWLYDEKTLRDICALREGLLSIKRPTDSSVILKALCLGALHGPVAKSAENYSYFSNQMPRTFASKPEYSVKFWKKNDLVPPIINVLNIIDKRLKKIEHTPSLTPSTFKHVIHGDSQQLHYFKKIKDSPSIIITSPPYFGMRTYVQDQWLRNWFLGASHEISYSNNFQLKHSNKETFIQSLGDVWRNVSTLNDSDIHMFIRYGVIPSAQVDTKRTLLESLEASGINWRLVSVKNAGAAPQKTRQAAQMRVNSSAICEYDFHISLY